MHLYQALADSVSEWKQQGYGHSDYNTIGEILSWASSPEGEGFRLRPPQIHALETYWYLRLVKATPHIFDLYQDVFPEKEDPDALLRALGVPPAAFQASKYDFENLWASIIASNEFVRKFKLEALRETLALNYPSYIFALAMGAGKTILIGAIFATEFAMAFEYPEGPFVQNALVFAPGKTIIESLRQLAETRFDRILPPRLFKQFAASIKITFTRDGDRDIPVIRKSLFNVIVTNTEKIRIQKETIRKADLGGMFAREFEEEARQEVANLRLQSIASLPHLAVFSDEAHHTYGQSLKADLKKVRKTVDYLASKTNVICIVNTTGTPYFQKQPLRDVVVWYSLSQGIHDHILKEVDDNIRSYDFDDNVEAYVSHVIEDFFKDYRDINLPDGTPSKLAMYFPQTTELAKLRPIIDAKLLQLGLSPTLVVEHHTSNENKVEFDRFRAKDSPHRIALLVDRGVEGWDVPPLFACALVRKLKSSNNFVLQAASRCLRQVPGNNAPARIYLSNDNRKALDKELQENYGETLAAITHASSKSRSRIVRLRKVKIPPLVVKQLVRTVVRKEITTRGLNFVTPKVSSKSAMQVTRLTLGHHAIRSVLQESSDVLEISTPCKTVHVYAAALEFAAVYRLDFWILLDRLRKIYDGKSEIPIAHLANLRVQVEEQTSRYEICEETRDVALALVKPDGFVRTLNAEDNEIYTAEISYPISKENLIKPYEEWRDLAGEFGFHYDPYNFDSNPEVAFLEKILNHLSAIGDQIEDVYFMGGFTDAKKTDFRVEYKDEEGKWRDYTPDFVIRCKSGKCLIVEIKDARFEASTHEDLLRDQRKELPVTLEGRKAVALKRWTQLDPTKLAYELIFARDNLEYDQLSDTREFIKQC